MPPAQWRERGPWRGRNGRSRSPPRPRSGTAPGRAPGAPGLVAVRAHAGGSITDTVLIVRLAPGNFLLLAEARAAGPPALAARARLALFVRLDSAQLPMRAASHAWTPMP